MTARTERVRLAVDVILLALHESSDPDEREEIAADLARIDHGGAARQTLADMASRALAEAKETG